MSMGPHSDQDFGEDAPLLEMMQYDLAGQRGIYKPGPFWQRYAQRTASAIGKHGLKNFRSNAEISKGYADVFINDHIQESRPGLIKSALSAAQRFPLTRSLATRYNQTLIRADRAKHEEKALRFKNQLSPWLDEFSREYGLPPTLAGNPSRTIQFDTGPIGEIYLRYFAWITEYSTKINFHQVESVFEIGGGFGGMAHTMLSLFPNLKKYLYLDIPPILYVGTQYLKHFFPDTVITYKDTKNLGSIKFSNDDSREIITLCPWQIERFEGAFDYFWNSSSFQEMPAEVVSNYAEQIARLMKKDGHLNFFTYDSKNLDSTLSSEQILSILRDKTGFSFEPLNTAVIQKILPGKCFLGDYSGAHSAR